MSWYKKFCGQGRAHGTLACCSAHKTAVRCVRTRVCYRPGPRAYLDDVFAEWVRWALAVAVHELLEVCAKVLKHLRARGSVHASVASTCQLLSYLPSAAQARCCKQDSPGTNRACCSLLCALRPSACKDAHGTGVQCACDRATAGRAVLLGSVQEACTDLTMWLLSLSILRRDISRNVVEGTPSSSICIPPSHKASLYHFTSTGVPLD